MKTVNQAAAKRLLVAIEHDDEPGFEKALSERAVDRNVPESFEDAAFTLACWRPTHARVMMRALLDAGLDPCLRKNKDHSLSKNVLYNIAVGTPLVMAWCRERHRFLKSKTQPWALLEREDEPEAGVMSASDQIILDLIEAGADPNVEVSSKKNRAKNTWEEATEASRLVVLEALAKRWPDALASYPFDVNLHPIVRTFLGRSRRSQGPESVAAWWAQRDPSWATRRQKGQKGLSLLMELKSQFRPEGVVWAIRHGAQPVDVLLHRNNPMPWTAWRAILDVALSAADDTLVTWALSQPRLRAALNVPEPEIPPSKVPTNNGQADVIPWSTIWDEAARRCRHHGAIGLRIMEALRAAGARSHQADVPLIERWARSDNFTAENEWGGIKATMNAWLDRHTEDDVPNPITGEEALALADSMTKIEWLMERGQRLDRVSPRGDQTFATLVRTAVRRKNNWLAMWCVKQWASDATLKDGRVDGRSVIDWAIGETHLAEYVKKSSALKACATDQQWFTLIETQKWSEAQKWLEKHPKAVGRLDEQGLSPWIALLNHRPFDSNEDASAWKKMAEQVVQDGARWDVPAPHPDGGSITIEARLRDIWSMKGDFDMVGAKTWCRLVLARRDMPESLWTPELYPVIGMTLWQDETDGGEVESARTMARWGVSEWSLARRAQVLQAWFENLTIAPKNDAIVHRWIEQAPGLLDVSLDGQSVAQRICDGLTASADRRDLAQRWFPFFERHLLRVEAAGRIQQAESLRRPRL